MTDLEQQIIADLNEIFAADHDGDIGGAGLWYTINGVRYFIRVSRAAEQ